MKYAIIFIGLTIIILLAIAIVYVYNKNNSSEPCPNGQWSDTGNKPGCKACNITCPYPKIIDKECTATSDITCKDPPPTTCPNSMWSPDGTYTDCIECTQCNEETEIVKTLCDTNTDTECEPAPTTCPDSMWSPNGTYTDCIECTQCNEETEIVKTPCNKNTDTECERDPSIVIYQNVVMAIGENPYDANRSISISADDGITWETTSSDTRITDAIWWDEKKIWVAIASGSNAKILTSLNAVDWTPVVNRVNADDFSSGLACNGTMCVVGHGSYGGEQANRFLSSEDGINWSISNQSPFYKVNSIEWSGNMWVATGNNEGNGDNATLAWSDNAIDWVSLGNDIFPIDCSVVKYNGSIWVAGGWGDELSISGLGVYPRIAYSTDGKIWSTSTIETNGSLVMNVSLAWNGLRWIMIQVDGMWSSVDGINWNHTLDGFEELGFFPTGIIWTGSQWMLVGNNEFLNTGGPSYVSISSDGETWVSTEVEPYYNYLARGKVPID